MVLSRSRRNAVQVPETRRGKTCFLVDSKNCIRRCFSHKPALALFFQVFEDAIVVGVLDTACDDKGAPAKDGATGGAADEDGSEPVMTRSHSWRSSHFVTQIGKGKDGIVTESARSSAAKKTLLCN